MARSFPNGFRWGAATSAHQTEGGNVNSDWWRMEQLPGIGLTHSGDAIDSYHRYEEDMRLLADAGLDHYRFSVEWARIEPLEGEFSRAQLMHYRRMIDTALGLGLKPVVTLHHFSNPQWFTDQGGWSAPKAGDAFVSYVERAADILYDVEWVCTINEPNLVSIFEAMARRGREGDTSYTPGQLCPPDEEIGRLLIDAHKSAAAVLHQRTDAKVGWTVAAQAFVAAPGCEEVHRRVQYTWEDQYLEAARGDDFVGVQSYTSQSVDGTGPVPHPEHPDNTLMGWAYRPDALGIALRNAWKVAGGTPLMVTENGIATDDDERRIAYTREALGHLLDAVDEGVDVRGYLHWSLVDNFEWGHWEPTFGLAAVDRESFERRPKPSLAWLGSVARANAL
ncbi:glycoside hydrolase family 1 protein [Allonocardiopsis opalescens]|uniref:Beta-glucosidase n=1 Tax=Allonocardiopsis opalescens TaxID=1144618 RepID=A0A2T0Q7F0_9ACTN|nr:family 1 glycosylhydrolase [Allonocardiopsis opalescens]PRX99760.1 beta-glucosidase [Allonocardiopsis opalescens]